MNSLFVQAFRFFGISGIGWILDFCTYTVLGLFSKNLFLNNIISSWIGVSFAFLFSTRFVFKNESRIPVVAKYVIYLLYQVLLIFAASQLVRFLNMQILQNFDEAVIVKSSYIIAKILVTPITMILNFCVMKLLIERI